ncbi:ABC transporter permease [Paenibacillus campi]|uniref:ABC transporter permease n=1 Tax=Paenibacillus campi TaxID=3106031 RepID=UPI002AFEC1C1|nr:ABC transporter permease [Paenibacillus sp. SGZ-1009]
MTFRQFAFNNVLRNKRLYAAYFLSSMFTVMIFFTFAVFAYHPALNGNDIHVNAHKALSTSKWLIYTFSFFFVLYSMSAFLKTRKREFGLLMLQGMSPGQLKRMVFLENIWIGAGATVGGILIGLVFAKAILLIGENILVLDERLNFYIPLQAIVITVVSFLLLFVLMSLFIAAIVRSESLISLIRSQRAPKSEPRASVWLSLLVVILLALSYSLSLSITTEMAVQLLLPIIVMVSIATYLLFTQLSVYVIGSLKKRPSFFWHRTNMLLLSDLSYRMKDNARTFFLVAMVSTISFCAIGTLYGMQTLLVHNGAPSAQTYPITYISQAGDTERDAHVQQINRAIQAAGIQPQQLQLTLNYYKLQQDETERVIINVTAFNQANALLGGTPIGVQGNQAAIAISSDNRLEAANRLKQHGISLSGGIKLQPAETVISQAIPDSSETLIVSDEQYQRLGSPVKVTKAYVWQSDASKKQWITAAEQILTNGTIKQYDEHYMTDIPMYTLYIVQSLYGISLFIGLFIGIVFFVSAGSFLYFRLYSDLDEDKQKFRAIAKLGLTDRELNRVLTRQIALLFFAPIIIALLHGSIALTTLAHLFNAQLLTECATVLGIFFMIQVVYFFIVRFFYIKQVREALQ